MKVRDLIAGAVLTEGADRGRSPAPRVSVLLPTFRRGDSGLLQRAIDSILAQSLRELELIIVDDASTDSTAAVIAAAMARDPRVSVIRHARNIGLPAVSEYEAYRIARGDRIAFAFDDTVFEPRALERLLAESDAHPGSLIAGWVTLFVHDDNGERTEKLGQSASVEQLLARNPIANSAVMAPRTLLERIGLYDPHVSVARVCDYDLWLRARRAAPLRIVDIPVGEEHGPATTDSLGSTYPLDQWLADDRMRQDRTAALLPEVFEEIDVFDAGAFASARSRAAVRALADAHREARPWMTAAETPATPAERVPRVLVLAHPIDASTLYLFDGPRDDPRVHLRIIDPTERSIAELLEADAVIISRQRRDLDDWIGVAGAIGIPVHLSLDDNLPLMREAGELGSAWDDYRAEPLRDAIADLTGMLASTPALAASFRDQGLHPRIATVPISAPRSVRQWTAPEPLAASAPHRARTPGIALFTGVHRLASFADTILPAVRAVAERRGAALRVLVPSAFIGAVPQDQLGDRVQLEPYEPSRDAFSALLNLREAGTDVLVIPDSPTINAPYKTHHPLLSAAALGSALLLPEVTPYADLRAVPGVELVSDPGASEGWAAALDRALTVRERGAAVPAAVLDERFAPEPAATAILEALGPLPAADEPRARFQRLVAWYSRELALTRVQISLEQRTAQRILQEGDAFGALLTDLHHEVRASRRVSVLRRRPTALARFGRVAKRGERVEVSLPLTASAYRSYPMTLLPGTYREALIPVWSSGLPEDLLGIEIVDPHGRLLAHAVAALPRDDTPQEVVVPLDGLRIAEAGIHEVRVFVKTNQPAFLLEAVHRGRLGMRAPVARPLITFVPAAEELPE